ncbi:hypothetical protein EKN35_12260 [Enterobacter asburiae]|uniref:hypothetical protein n=1 Tax=Enterobacter asburiae TaxID=61645 RepID=UPI000F87E89C|nr:hypothetical protein [Enterobacter asburiae]RTP91985.1 hypothetical protein EKN35_12260 [Enterobacter asburiae]
MLIERYKLDFIKAALLLNTLKENPESYGNILGLHKLIIRGVSKQEKLISYDKAGIKRLKFFKRNRKPSREQSIVINDVIDKLTDRVMQRKHIIFLYKCFGDGIANVYQSMYALKHLYYDKNYRIKEDAGYISGKSGFIREWKVFLTGLKHGVPVVMSDITNIIRTGDVCALGGEDPVPIEVKLTKHDNPSARVRRQIENINEIVSFYDNDYAPMFRGVGDTYRVPLTFKQKDYISDVNILMKTCQDQSYAFKEVEKGLLYVCIHATAAKSDWEILMKEIDTILNPKSTLSIFINPEESWGVAYPFTLSFTPPNLIRYIYGEFVILILVDLEYIRGEFAKNKLHAVFLMDGTTSIQFCKDPNDLTQGVFRISEQNFLRNFISFLSLEIFIKEQCRYFDQDLYPIKGVSTDEYESLLESGRILSEEILKDWSEAKDCLRD